MSFRFFNFFLSVLFIVSCSSDSESPEEEIPVVNLATLSTASVTSITENSAMVGGNVLNDGGGQITERGVVWSISANPTLSDNKVASGSGAGEFNITLSGLERNTQYFLRTYAINSAGTAYGNEVSFNTMASMAMITTIAVSEITENSAISGGEIIDDGGAEIISRGVCWSISINPTIEDNISEDGEGLGTFSSELKDLESGTTYYVRAYAENQVGVVYGNELEFTTSESSLKIFEGDVILKTQQEVDDFGNGNYGIITGNLTLGDRFVGTPSDITDLSALKELVEVGLKLDIWNNDNLIDFSGLEKLSSVGGDLEINGNDGILDFSGLDNLNILGGELIIWGNDSLEDMNRFEQVLSQAITIFIFRNDNLSSLSAFGNITELNGDIRISLNAALGNLDDFASLRSINGNFELLTNESLNHINGLTSLSTINGDFVVRSNGLLEIIGLNELEMVTGQISIENNASLANISGFNNLNKSNGLSISFNSESLQLTGFESLQNLDSDLLLAGFGVNQEVNAFSNLSSVNGDISILSSILFNLNFLSNLRLVGGDFTINRGGSLGSPMGLENLERVGGSLQFFDTSFQDLDNFPSLVEVGGFLTLRFNENLRDVEFVNLRSVGAGVLIEGNLNPLFNLDELWGLESIGGDLTIKTNNPSASGTGLTNLNAFGNLSTVGGNIELTNNPNLEDYCDIRDLLTTFTGSFTVDNNRFNPSQQDIVDGNCSQ